MNQPSFPSGCDCSPVNRRHFLKTTASAIASASILPGTAILRSQASEPRPKTLSETLVTTLYKSLNDEQRKAVCFAFDHPLRSKVDNNWHITDKKLSLFFTPDQQQMVKEIFMGLHSPEYAETVLKQVEHDSEKE